MYELTTLEYSVALFVFFSVTRWLAIMIRTYYDLHVYNFYRFVQTVIQCWIFEDVVKLRSWAHIGQADEEHS